MCIRDRKIYSGLVDLFVLDEQDRDLAPKVEALGMRTLVTLSLIHISEPTRLLSISYAVFCLKKKNTQQLTTHIN
mgnify:CR=1 FL=1